jgi:signal transduction histidine kinase
MNYVIIERKLAKERVPGRGSQLIRAQEMERTRIARELHDDLNQRLALLSLEVDLLGRRPPSSTNEFRRRTHDLKSRIQMISTDIQRIAYQLHPSNLDLLGLAAALHRLCNEISDRQVLRVKFIHRNVPESLPKDVALCLFRIAQEALRNVIKHSGVQDARVELIVDSEAIRLCVADAGAGFDIESAKKNGGLGLISMQERLRLVGGEISIKSQPARGTQIDVQIPLAARG